jgi:hypothetical protein
MVDVSGMYVVWHGLERIASDGGHLVDWLFVHLGFPLNQLTLEHPIQVSIGSVTHNGETVGVLNEISSVGLESGSHVGFVDHAFSMAQNRAKVKR